MKDFKIKNKRVFAFLLLQCLLFSLIMGGIQVNNTYNQARNDLNEPLELQTLASSYSLTCNNSS